MAEVVITLALKRKSGILAAAVSAVNRAGLEFGSHQFVELDSGYGIQLNAKSEEGWNDPAGIAEELAGIRGVDQVLDIELDGRSLLGGISEPEVELRDGSADEPEEPGPKPQQPLAAGLNSAARPPHKPDAGQAPAHKSAPSTPPQAADDRPLADGKPLPAGVSTSMRPSMIRRRRRRR